MDAATLPKMLTAMDVSLWLSLPTRTIERLARGGKMPSRMLPTGDLVFDADDLAAWLRRQPCAKESRQ